LGYENGEKLQLSISHLLAPHDETERKMYKNRQHRGIIRAFHHKSHKKYPTGD
jgi:hypothetical protein